MAAQDTTTVSDEQSATNGGGTLDGGDTLTIAAADSQGAGGGSIAVTGDGVHAISAAGAGNTVYVNGSVSANGDGAHAIRNESGASEYHIRSDITVLGANSHAVHNEAGAATYTLHDGFAIAGTDANGNGILNTEVATAILDLTGLTGSYGLHLQGDWQAPPADGGTATESLRHTAGRGWLSVVRDARTTTNGGFAIDGNAHFTLGGPDAAITPPAGNAGLFITGDNNRVFVHGAVAISNSQFSTAAVIAVYGSNDNIITLGSSATLSASGDAFGQEFNGGVLNLRTNDQAPRTEGSDNRFVINGVIQSSDDVAPPVNNRTGRNNVFEINGTVRAGSASESAIVNSGTLEGNRFILGANAVIEGVLTAIGSSAILEIDIVGNEVLGLRTTTLNRESGAWLDGNGNGWLTEFTDFQGDVDGRVYIVGEASEATNNDHNLGGNDHLLLAAGAAITTTADAAHGIHNAGDNRYTVRGAIATGGAGAHAIYHESGDSLYTIAGSLEAAGTDAYIIYNLAGNGRYLIEEGASLGGTLRAADGVTATLLVPATFELADCAGTFADARLEGSWVDGDGAAFALAGLVSSAATATNGGHPLATCGGLRVAGSGSIDTGSAGGESAIAVTSPVATVTVNGPLTARGADAHGIHVDSAGGVTTAASAVQVNAAVTVAGSGAHGIYHEAGTVEYSVTAAVSASGTEGHGIHHESGTADYAISAAVSASGTDGYAIYHQAGMATFRLLAGAAVTGTVKTDAGATLTFGPGVSEWNLDLEGDWRDGDGLRVNATSAAAQAYTVDFRDAMTNGGFRVDGQDTLVIESGMEGMGEGSMAFGIVTAADETPAVLLPAGAAANTVTVEGLLETQGAGSPVMAVRGAGSVVAVAASGVVRAAAANGQTGGQAGRAGSHGVEVSGNGVMVSLAAGSAVTVDGAGAHGIYNTAGVEGGDGNGGDSSGGNGMAGSGTASLQDGSGGAAGGGAAPLRDGNGATGSGTASLQDGNGGGTTGGGTSPRQEIGSEGEGGTTASPNSYNVAGNVTASGSEGHAIFHEAGVAGYAIAAAIRASGTDGHAIYHRAGTATYRFAADADIAAAADSGGRAIYHEAGTGTYSFETGAAVAGTLRADAPATLAAPHGFDFSGMTLEGEWNHAPTATGTALAPPDPLPAEGVAWAWAPVNLDAVFSDRDMDDSLTYAFAADGLPDWLTASAADGVPMVAGTPPAGSAGSAITLAVTATDGAAGTVPARAEIMVVIGMPQPAGRPVVTNPIGPRRAVTGQGNFAVALAGVFADPDRDPLTIRAGLADGSALPSWLVLDRESVAAPRLFAATVGAAGTYMIRVTATDGNGMAEGGMPSLPGGGNGNGGGDGDGDGSGSGDGNGGDGGGGDSNGGGNGNSGGDGDGGGSGGDGNTVAAEFTLTVISRAAEPEPPMAEDDRLSFTRGERPPAVSVLDNDFDANLDPLEVAWFWVPGNAANRVAAGATLALPELGDLTLRGDGTFMLILNDAARVLGADSSLSAMAAYLVTDGTDTGTDGMAMIGESSPAVGTLTLTVTGSDKEPTVAPARAWAVPALTAWAGIPFRYAVPGNVFRDGNLERLEYTAERADGGSLPEWLDFDTEGGLFSGIPAAADVSDDPVALILRATDAAGDSATAAFTLTVAEAPGTATLTVGGEGMATLRLPYVTALPGVSGGIAPCLGLTLTAPVANLSAWEFDVGEPAMACGVAAGVAGVPLLDGARNLDVPLATFVPAGGSAVCLAMEFRLADMFVLTAMAAVPCPAP